MPYFRASLIAVVVWALFVVATGRAVDHEHDQASVREPVAVASPSVRSPVSQAVGYEPASLAESFEWRPGVTCPRTAHGCATRAEIASVNRAIARRFGTGWKGSVARCVAYVESGFNPFATNGRDRHSDGSVGSFGWPQIGALHRASGESVRSFARRMYDPAAAAEKAWRLSRGGTRWSAWTGSRRCWA